MREDRKQAGLGHELALGIAPRSTGEERLLSLAFADLPSANDPLQAFDEPASTTALHWARSVIAEPCSHTMGYTA